jgi:small conductance mechanosensitive channel
VVIDGQEGIVVALTSRATILMTLDGNHLHLPNALVFRSVMLNYTRNPSRRFEFDIGVGVQEDLIQAQLIGTQELQHLVGVMDDPPPRALIQSLGDSNVQLRFRGWAAQLTTACVLIHSLARTGVSFRVLASLLHGSPSYRASSIWPTDPIRHPSYIESTANEK